jgi:hypothetical protein
MTKKIFHAIAFLIFAFAFGLANAQMLCSPPLPPDCIDPQWGQIEPDSALASTAPNDGSASDASTVDRAASAAGPHIRLAQMNTAARALNVPKLFIEDAKRFERETRALVRAIEHATFTQAGKLKSGEEAIAKAAEALRGPSKKNQLNLYVKIPSKLASRDQKALIAKVDAVNSVIEKALGEPSYPRKTPNS